MAVTSYKKPGSGKTVDGFGGTLAWSNPGRITADDNSDADRSLSGAADSQLLVAYNFGFTTADVPSGSTINGVEFRFERLRSTGTGNVASIVYGIMRDANQASPSDFGFTFATGANWTGTRTVETVGSSSFMAGYSSADIDAVLRTADFGVFFAASLVGGSTSTGAVDYIECRIHYTPGTVDGVGSTSGSGTATGVGQALKPAAGSASGVGAATGVGNALKPASGSASGTGAASGVGATISAAVGAASGAGSASGVGISTAASAGASAGQGTGSGVGSSIAASVGSAAGAATDIGSGEETVESAGSSSGSATVTGIGAAVVEAVGSSSGQGTPSGVGTGIVEAVGASDGEADADGVGAVIGTGVGSSSGTGTASGEGRSTAEAVGSAQGTSDASGIQGVVYAAVGSASGSSSAEASGQAVAPQPDVELIDIGDGKPRRDWQAERDRQKLAEQRRLREIIERAFRKAAGTDDDDEPFPPAPLPPKVFRQTAMLALDTAAIEGIAAGLADIEAMLLQYQVALAAEMQRRDDDELMAVFLLAA